MDEIILGTPICEKLKVIYFSDIPWVNCYRDVAAKFIALKAIARRFYVDKTNVEVLNELIKYSDQDIYDAFGTNQQG